MLYSLLRKAILFRILFLLHICTELNLLIVFIYRIRNSSIAYIAPFLTSQQSPENVGNMLMKEFKNLRKHISYSMHKQKRRQKQEEDKEDIYTLIPSSMSLQKATRKEF